MVVPHSLKQKALSQAHEQSGHLGQKKTIKKAEDLFYWCNLKVDVSNNVRQCIPCQRFKGSTGLQQPFKELPSVGKPVNFAVSPNIPFHPQNKLGDLWECGVSGGGHEIRRKCIIF